MIISTVGERKVYRGEDGKLYADFSMFREKKYYNRYIAEEIAYEVADEEFKGEMYDAKGHMTDEYVDHLNDVLGEITDEYEEVTD